MHRQRAAEDFSLGIDRSQHSGDTVEERKMSTGQGASDILEKRTEAEGQRNMIGTCRVSGGENVSYWDRCHNLLADESENIVNPRRHRPRLGVLNTRTQRTRMKERIIMN
jgi:hypothetical protein